MARRRILTDENLKEMVKDIYKKGIFMKEAAKKYGIGVSTVRREIKIAVTLGLITPKQRQEWMNKQNSRSFEAKVKKDGLEKAIKSCRYGWERGVGSSPTKLSDAGKIGGLVTQILHPYTMENIKKYTPYQPNECYYNDIKFSSRGERFVALLLKEYKLIDEIIPGENFQVKFGEKKRLDFLVLTPDCKIVGIEYHPIPKNHPKINETLTGYENRRKIELKESGFDEGLLVISKFSDFYKKLEKLGIKKDFPTHCEIMHAVRAEIAAIDYAEENQ